MHVFEKYNIHPSIIGLMLFVDANNGKEGYILEMLKTRMFEFKIGDKTLYQIMLEQDLVKLIKSGKKEEVYRVRISDHGRKILREMVQKPEHELAEECWNILKEAYTIYRIPKEKIVNQTKTIFYISEFLYEKEIQGKAYTPKMFKAVVCDYLNSLAHGKEHLAKRTLKLLYDPSNQYASKWNTEDSPLWNWSEQHKDTIINVYRNLK